MMFNRNDGIIFIFFNYIAFQKFNYFFDFLRYIRERFIKYGFWYRCNLGWRLRSIVSASCGRI